nr:MAG TPA: hypothetical protein [Caudoviricetes sp.]
MFSFFISVIKLIHFLYKSLMIIRIIWIFSFQSFHYRL